MDDKFEQVAHYPMLRDEQRIEARRQARENLMARLGGEPQFEDFERKHVSRFGPGINRGAFAFAVLVLGAAFIISAVHIFSTGYEAYNAGHSSQVWASIIGGAFVVLAEASIIALSIIPPVWETPPSVTRSMYLGIAGSAFIATIGNIDATIIYTSTPFDWVKAWAMALSKQPAQWALATLPPMLTVLVGMGLKYYVLTRSHERQEAKVNHEKAMREWRTIVDNLEVHENWIASWANALWDAWCYKKRRDVLAEIPIEDKRLIVQREMEADLWFEREFTGMQQNSGRMQQNSDMPAKARVVLFLRENPEIAEQLGDGSMQQSEVASMLGVSQASVSRGLTAYSQNGHHE